MSKQIHIRIAKPCHQNWNEMTANEQGAFCKSCKKNVTDFTNKTENEIYNIVTGARGELCGRFSAFQLEQPVRKTELKNGWLNWRAIAASLAAFFSFNKVFATGDLDTIPKKTYTIKSAPEVVITASPRPAVLDRAVVGNMTIVPIPNTDIRGKVIEQDSKEPIAFAHIYLKKAQLGAISDENGNFLLAIDPVMYKDDTIVVTYVGFEREEFPVAQFKADKPIELKMREAQMMGMMVVIKEVPRMDEGINLLHTPLINLRNQHSERSRWKRE